MRIAIHWTLVVAMTASVAVAQEKRDQKVAVLTVCEVIGDVNRYADTDVAVVGRLESSVSLVDHYNFLSQDHCSHPIVTGGHVWSNKIWVTGWEDGMPEPPRDTPKLKSSVIAAKLVAVRKTTGLGSHQEPVFKSDGRTVMYSHNRAAPNEWMLVYGRVVRMPDLKEDCGAEGCGGFDAPLAIICEPQNTHRLGPDGKLLPSEK